MLISNHLHSFSMKQKGMLQNNMLDGMYSEYEYTYGLVWWIYMQKLLGGDNKEQITKAQACRFEGYALRKLQDPCYDHKQAQKVAVS